MTLRHIKITVTPEEAGTIEKALAGYGTLGVKVARQIEAAWAIWREQEIENQRVVAARAKRAHSHILTKRQAQALAAVRANQGPFSVWDESWGRPRWRRGRTMGGAVARMVDTLINEGLLDSNRKITEPGRIRLEAWEDKHGRVGP